MKADYECTLTLAIDGPAASGKSVVGREVARRLGIRFLDTGAHVSGHYIGIDSTRCRRG